MNTYCVYLLYAIKINRLRTIYYHNDHNIKHMLLAVFHNVWHKHLNFYFFVCFIINTKYNQPHYVGSLLTTGIIKATVIEYNYYTNCNYILNKNVVCFHTFRGYILDKKYYLSDSIHYTVMNIDIIAKFLLK